MENTVTISLIEYEELKEIKKKYEDNLVRLFIDYEQPYIIGGTIFTGKYRTISSYNSTDAMKELLLIINEKDEETQKLSKKKWYQFVNVNQ